MIINLQTAEFILSEDRCLDAGLQMETLDYKKPFSGPELFFHLNFDMDSRPDLPYLIMILDPGNPERTFSYSQDELMELAADPTVQVI